jgi:hypothetical protein
LFGKIAAEEAYYAALTHLVMVKVPVPAVERN